MKNPTGVRCAENQELASYMANKWKEMADQPKGISDNIEMALSKAHFNVSNSKTPIRTIKEFSQVKGVGKMILKLMQGFFGIAAGGSEPEDLKGKGKRNKGMKRYVPQRNSVAYALLITLYRRTGSGEEFMRKQELIDAAEASGLSRVPIAPEKGKGKPGRFGSSPREWYSGWNCMKTLIDKGLVVKSSCPAKYMLTEEGKSAARDCLSRSGMAESHEKSVSVEIPSHMDTENLSDREVNSDDSESEILSPLRQQKKPMDVPLESLSRFTDMGFSKEQIVRSFAEVSRSHPNEDVSSLWPAVLCHLREEQIYGSHPKSPKAVNDCHVTSANIVVSGSTDLIGKKSSTANSACNEHVPNFSSDIPPFPLRACPSAVDPVQRPKNIELSSKMTSLSVPPLRFGEKFEEVYEVILILDDREQFATQGSRSRKIIEEIRSQFKIQIEVRRLPVGDGIWIARHKTLKTEYVLDFIVERKKIDDLRSSIRDNRYRDQKLRLLRCGLKKLIYLVEGDPNASEASECIKTACFTTEILEGFDVQRTSGLGDTLRKYAYLTQAISQCYKSRVFEGHVVGFTPCPPFGEFIKQCQDSGKMTVSDVFAIQLMQVPQVTEEVAMAVLDLYPTLLSLAHAYSLLDGDSCAQEDMLRARSNNAITAGASRNIFQFIWGS
ncbi:Crossover junction endonuclease mus81 [Stylosanthes scabra]|uniref:Crossover junction endonuclease MUS81 n=1 Tax=Stylosanthes scabra TaxID=79078 RepID=A0ABU6WIZ2_9FABA|nr:Crossover junction endonuclease mus81 [Stylosanthes scabra]